VARGRMWGGRWRSRDCVEGGNGVWGVVLVVVSGRLVLDGGGGGGGEGCVVVVVERPWVETRETLCVFRCLPIDLEKAFSRSPLST